MSNILITPNVIINCLLSYDNQENVSYSYFLKRVLDLEKKNQVRIYMTEIDILIIFSYFWIFYTLQNNENISILKDLEEYLLAVNPYPLDYLTLERATTYTSMNPSDALRLATTMSPDIEIESIVTWEPSHFAQKSDDRIYIQNNKWGNIWVEDSELAESNETVAINIDVYNPETFFSLRKDFDSPSEFSTLKPQKNNANKKTFNLVDFNVSTNMKESNVQVILQYTEQSKTKPITMSMPNQGAIYALIESINLCVEQQIQSSSSQSKINIRTIMEKLRGVIFSIDPAPAKDMDSRGVVNLSLNSDDLWTKSSDQNIIKATAIAHLELVNSLINQEN